MGYCLFNDGVEAQLVVLSEISTCVVFTCWPLEFRLAHIIRQRTLYIYLITHFLVACLILDGMVL